jgi:EAL domain-containing protein (putative c-di-GMP-specific phosphodiesterase class I)
VVAEGVEDLATFDRLAEFGCDEAQGYYISRPLSAAEFTRWLSVRNLELEVAQSDGRRATDQRDDPGRERLRVV